MEGGEEGSDEGPADMRPVGGDNDLIYDCNDWDRFPHGHLLLTTTNEF